MASAAAPPRRSGLSKSRITLFEQCPKRLWLAVHRPELAEETLAVTTGFAVGHAVGALACALIPDGHMVDAGRGLGAAVDETRRLLAGGWQRPLFEATFVHGDVLVRVDLMLPTAAGWHVAEVKSNTAVKPYHLADLATQLWVMRASGITIAGAAIRHLDRAFVLRDPGDHAGLFVDAHVAAEVEPLVAGRGLVVAQARATLAGDEPDREPGAHCDQPFACSFKQHCSRHLPPAPEWPTSLLPDAAGKKAAATLAASGITDLLEVHADALPNERLRRIHSVTGSGAAFCDTAAIRAETGGWAYGLRMLDDIAMRGLPRCSGSARAPANSPNSHIKNPLYRS